MLEHFDGRLPLKEQIRRMRQSPVDGLVEERLSESKFAQTTPVDHGPGLLPVNADGNPIVEPFHPKPSVAARPGAFPQARRAPPRPKNGTRAFGPTRPRELRSAPCPAP